MKNILITGGLGFIGSHLADCLSSNHKVTIIDKLSKLINKGATFVHCFASVERSPLICILYIMTIFNLEIEEALDYILSKHEYTNPTNKQLKLIKDFKNNFN